MLSYGIHTTTGISNRGHHLVGMVRRIAIFGEISWNKILLFDCLKKMEYKCSYHWLLIHKEWVFLILSNYILYV